MTRILLSLCAVLSLAACGREHHVPAPTPIPSVTVPTMTPTSSQTPTPTETPTNTPTAVQVVGAVWSCLGGRCTTSAR